MLMIKNLILSLLVLGTASLKNPCRRNSPIEFHPHPDSVQSYIQCTKRGEMFVKKCTDNSEWNNEIKKCGEVSKRSQIKTLANTFKLKTLLAKKALTEQQQQDIDKMNVANEERGQRIINQIQEAQTARELIQLEKQAATQNEVIRQAQAQISQDTLRNNEDHSDRQVFQLQQQIDQHNAMVKQGLNSVEQMKADQKKHDQMGKLKQAFSTQSDLMKRMNFWSTVRVPSQTLETTTAAQVGSQDVENMFKEEEKTQEVALTTTTTMSPRDQMLLDNQLKQQEQMIAQQRFREELMMKQQELSNQFMIKQRKLQEERIVQQQKDLQQKQFEHQSMLLNNMITRQRKEREMCSHVTCPEDYQCFLNEEDVLMCRSNSPQ